MYCTNCGAANKEEAELCINCGESLSEDLGEESLPQQKKSSDVSILKEANILRPLFDFSFGQLASPKIMTFLYGLSILWAGLIAVFLVIVGFNVSRGLGIFALFVGAPLTFLIMVIYSRVFLEMVLITFRIMNQQTTLQGDMGLYHQEDHSESKDSIQWNV
ncbi:MAG: DUF4282 domain-containing protein [Syntrophaceae bacterium]|nr:DUF4282 domain-containing protein [Syntrophaceae bacterium]